MKKKSKNREIFARVYFRETPREMTKSLCRLLIYVNHVLVANSYVANMYFNDIRENKILAKISGLTVSI